MIGAEIFPAIFFARLGLDLCLQGPHLAQCARSASTVQLFGRVAVLESHTL